MWFVTLHKPYRGQVNEVMIRADLVLEITTRRHKKSDDEYIPIPGDEAKEPGDVKGTWVLVDRLGWTPCIETPAEVAHVMMEAEVAYRTRLAMAKVT
jgi:hypothetical protein